MKDTPMMRQYREIKRQYEDAILFFRLGDFYEMFFDDAKIAAQELDIVLTSREAGKGKKVPMAGVPYHAAESYISKLIRRGYKIAICEQVEDPETAKGLVRREVVRVITPGTVMENELLEDKSNNFLVALAREGDRVGLAVVDYSTGEFMVTEFSPPNVENKTRDEIGRLSPAECLVGPGVAGDRQFTANLEKYGISVTVGHEWDFSYPAAYDKLTAHFKTSSLRGFGCEDKPAAAKAAGGLLAYLEETQKSNLGHITSLKTYSTEEYMTLDGATRRNLELVARLQDSSRQGSLLWVLDRTVTAMGGRMLRAWVEMPLLDLEKVERRLEAVADMKEKGLMRVELTGLLKSIHDLERILGRVACGRAHARDLKALGQSLEVLPRVVSVLEQAGARELVSLKRELDCLEDIHQLISGAIVEDPPVTLKEGGLIRAGYHAEVDRWRQAQKEGKAWIASLEARERERTGIKSLKVGFNKVFGYYIEVTNPNRDLVPEDYTRKQTLANAERYITPELKEQEALILGARERLKELEYQLFVEVRDRVADQTARIQKTSRVLAELDALRSLAEVAEEHGYCRPVVHQGDEIKIKGGRHPVLEKTLNRDPFVPNDTLLDSDQNQILIVTGPNMAGKSTYLRQVALITLMAQMGSFVPADEAQVGMVDRIFTRVGASDDLSMGQSTFMVEMNEVANILNNATCRSLIILDEVGRGTSTFDGLSIAWAVVEFLHGPEGIGAKTLFATHYHELTELEEVLPGVKNYSVAVKEQGEDVIFLRKIVRGGSDRSYGIQVARLAGLPAPVVARAREILAKLERDSRGQRAGQEAAAAAEKGRAVFQQPTFFEPGPNPVVEEVKQLNILAMTPLDALNTLYRLQQKAKGEWKK